LADLFATYEVATLGFLPVKLLSQHLDTNSTDTGRLELIERFVKIELPATISALFEAFSKQARELVYIQPLREVPDRTMDLRACTLVGWRWLAKRPELVHRMNTTLERMKFDHRIHLQKLMPVDALKSTVIAATCHAETGDNWGSLSSAVKSARDEWTSFKPNEKRKWVEARPAFFQMLVKKGHEILESPDAWYAFYEENPEASDQGLMPTDEWFLNEAVRLAWTYVNAWDSDANSRFYDDAVRLHISGDADVRAALKDALSGQSLKDVIESNVEHVGLRLHDPKNDVWTAVQDVGVGTSQSLPIILEALAQQDKLIAIEQPELHLHPALQAELGDMFIESALGENKNTFLMETHSEHLLLRIMRRMRQTAEGKLPEGMLAVRPENVALLFISSGPEGSVVQDIGLNERGELIKAWPGGFFEEGFNEMFD
jgi:hypothetical protein